MTKRNNTKGKTDDEQSLQLRSFAVLFSHFFAAHDYVHVLIVCHEWMDTYILSFNNIKQ